MALSPVLHVAGFGGTVAVESRPIAPLGIEFNSVRRVGDHHGRSQRASQARHSVRGGSVAAQNSVLPTEPEITKLRSRLIRNWRNGIGSFVKLGAGKELIDLA